MYLGPNDQKKTKSIEIVRFKMETSPKEMINGTQESDSDHKIFEKVIKDIIQ